MAHSGADAGTRTRTRTLQRIGQWLYPSSSLTTPALVDEQHFRIGVLGLVCAATGLAASGYCFHGMSLAAGLLIPDGNLPTPSFLVAGIALVSFSVFLPQAIFRTGAESSARKILDAPSMPIQPWIGTTIPFNAVLVGAMIGGVYFQPEVFLLLVGAAFLIRILVMTKFGSAHTPNSRYHAMIYAWTMSLIAAVAYAIVRPLAPAVTDNHSIVPLLLAGVIAMYIGLTLSAFERWARVEIVGWAVIREAVDGRRFLVALICAGIAWLVTFTGEALFALDPLGDSALPILAALGVFLACWLLLWITSIGVWRAEAVRTLRMWSRHQIEITTRIADGSLNPELALKAALTTTSRMAVVVFGATKVLTIHDDGHNRTRMNLVTAGRYERTLPTDPSIASAITGQRIPLYSKSNEVNSSSVTISDCLVPGWFASRSPVLVQTFIDLATMSMSIPSLANRSDRSNAAFTTMFDHGHRWPTMAALLEALHDMRDQFDKTPHLSSLVLGVYSIDEFAAISGGRHEHAAISQIMRMALSNPAFTGHDVFVSYENPGRIWVALSGGPVIRNTVHLLRELKKDINSHQYLNSTSLDIAVFVNVSLGYAAHHVDDFTIEGLIQTALDRLSTEQAARNPFADADFSTLVITPESIIEHDQPPITAENLLQGLLRDRGTSHLTTWTSPAIDTQTGTTTGLLIGVGWDRKFRNFDMKIPANFLKALNRQPQLAGLAAEIGIEALIVAMAESEKSGLGSIPCMTFMPAILLHPDSGVFALPNLIVPLLERTASTRTVLLFEDIPSGAGQALRMLVDRGLHVGVTAAAAAGADPADLIGWPRWGVLFPPAVMQSPIGVDGLTVQQTATAVANQSTRLIGLVAGPFDRQSGVVNNITATIELSSNSALSDQMITT